MEEGGADLIQGLAEARKSGNVSQMMSSLVAIRKSHPEVLLDANVMK